ncbi:response regulator [Aliikangiella maris]|uniref:Response regulator n=2 Tax=Aliikangiella maris TaxID=3162458 RepID=A0ABV3MK36_9GAMM
MSVSEVEDPVKVLVIDDDATARKAVTQALKAPEFEIIQAANGIQGIEKAVENMPDIILLDVDMPGQNGYETCDQFRQIDETKSTPIIFLSSLSNLRSRLQGFESGADDYLVKPWSKEELLAKMDILIRHRRLEKSLQGRVELAEVTAMQALTDNSGLGQAIHFVDSCIKIGDIEELLIHLGEFLSLMGLKYCVMYRFQEVYEFFSHKHNIKPLEKELMKLLLKQPRFFDFGCRTQINYPNISVLIKNMPLQNREFYGQLKDLLPFIISSVDNKINEIESEIQLKKQTEYMIQSFDTIKSTLTDLTSSLIAGQNEASEIARLLMYGLNAALPNMGLDDDQEKFLMDSIENSVHAMLDYGDNIDDIKSSFDLIMNSLESMIQNQSNHVKSMLARKKLNQKEDSPQEDINDIELF